MRLFRPELMEGASLSLTRQLCAAIELWVAYGDLSPGSPLPSIRKLAATLDVAPGTVVRSYQHLIAEGVADSDPRRGFIVAESYVPGPAEVRRPLVDLVDEVVRAADDLEPRQFLNLVAERLNMRKAAAKRVAVVGYREAALAERASEVAHALRDLGAEALTVAYEDLLAGECVDVATFDVYLVQTLQVKYAAKLLRPHADRIVPMTFQVQNDTREFVRRQHPNVRFGIVAKDEDGLSRTLVALRRLHPLRVPPLLATDHDQARVAELLRKADALILGVGALRHLAQSQPLRLPWVSFVLIPDEATFGRVRAHLLGRHSPKGDSGHVPLARSMSTALRSPELTLTTFAQALTNGPEGTRRPNAARSQVPMALVES